MFSYTETPWLIGCTWFFGTFSILISSAGLLFAILKEKRLELFVEGLMGWSSFGVSPILYLSSSISLNSSEISILLSSTHLFAFYNFYLSYLLLFSNSRTIFILYIRRYEIAESHPFPFLSLLPFLKDGVGIDPYNSSKAFSWDKPTCLNLGYGSLNFCSLRVDINSICLLAFYSSDDICLIYCLSYLMVINLGSSLRIGVLVMNEAFVA